MSGDLTDFGGNLPLDFSDDRAILIAGFLMGMSVRDP